MTKTMKPRRMIDKTCGEYAEKHIVHLVEFDLISTYTGARKAGSQMIHKLQLRFVLDIHVILLDKASSG